MSVCNGTMIDLRVRLAPQCYFCGTPCYEEDFCYGCRKYVCSRCDETHPVGHHQPEEHKRRK